jgi:hypothetical protein
MTDTKHDDGGAAFATLNRDPWGNMTARGGMSLRDWFAGQALNGICAAVMSSAKSAAAICEDENPEVAIAKMAYEYAERAQRRVP